MVSDGSLARVSVDVATRGEMEGTTATARTGATSTAGGGRVTRADSRHPSRFFHTPHSPPLSA